MKPIRFIFILLICASFVVAHEKRATTYGVYCGLGHGNDYGLEPIDELDRVCQIHDICVSALGYTSCRCNEQLYASVTMYDDTNKQQKDTKDYILGMIYKSIIGCNNYNELNSYFINDRVPGQNYIPFFPHKLASKYVIVQESADVSYYEFTDFEYYLFTRNAFKSLTITGKIVNNYDKFYRIKIGAVLVAYTTLKKPNYYTTVNVEEFDEGASEKISNLLKTTSSTDGKNNLIFIIIGLSILIVLAAVAFFIFNRRQIIRSKKKKQNKLYELVNNGDVESENLKET